MFLLKKHTQPSVWDSSDEETLPVCSSLPLFAHRRPTSPCNKDQLDEGPGGW